MFINYKIVVKKRFLLRMSGEIAKISCILTCNAF
nr:MAG TPA: hypothetical protein [Caudoviricetes sp.]